MTLAEKLRFLADRTDDRKQFYIMYADKKILTDYEEFTESYDIQELEAIALSLKPRWEFTEDEKIILKNLPDEFEWIARDKYCDDLYAYTERPHKDKKNWYNTIGSTISVEAFNHLFKSIEWDDDKPCEFRKYL